MKSITVIYGHYGSGKSTVAANLAVRAASRGERVRVIDMDAVNPYYRTADLKSVFEDAGVSLTAPMYANTNIDTPVLDFDIPSLYEGGEKLIIDMGGDDAGAYPLGRYADFILQRDADVLYTVNFRRIETLTPAEALAMAREIETACRIPMTGIVNNTNLGLETDPDIIREGMEKAEGMQSAAPVIYHTVPKIPACEAFLAENVDKENILPVSIYLRADRFAQL